MAKKNNTSSYAGLLYILLLLLPVPQKGQVANNRNKARPTAQGKRRCKLHPAPFPLCSDG
jgi:hypothetical protein